MKFKIVRYPSFFLHPYHSNGILKYVVVCRWHGWEWLRHHIWFRKYCGGSCREEIKVSLPNGRINLKRCGRKSSCDLIHYQGMLGAMLGMRHWLRWWRCHHAQLHGVLVMEPIKKCGWILRWILPWGKISLTSLCIGKFFPTDAWGNLGLSFSDPTTWKY